MQYQLLPNLSGEEFDALKADIAKRGVQVPVEYDDAGNILDGHHRIRACEELGIEEWPCVIRGDLSEEEKVEHILSLNLNRRHLDREQKRALAADLLMRMPEKSDRHLGRMAGADHKTVGAVRAGLEESGEIPQFEKREDPRTGERTQPATKPTAKPSAVAENRTKAEEVFAQIAEGGGMVVHQQAAIAEPEDEPEAPAPSAHVANNSGDNEWYTPQEYIDAAREVMGGIDLDPASTPTANAVVGADTIFTAEDDGLQQEWRGRVWMNPPYAQPLVGQFAEKLAGSLPQVSQAIVLVNNATETQWFQRLGEVASAICFPRGRVRFWAPDKVSAPLQGQAILYIGGEVESFCRVFARFGLVVRV
jgi:phage N-6-adenine-methyltransferase